MKIHKNVKQNKLTYLQYQRLLQHFYNKVLNYSSYMRQHFFYFIDKITYV